ncbi:MAG TPA: LamG domain-containing protein [Spirochaetia bacterium]|nr:LamG domain-containing protein [Spirochaetia bacterium]
MKNMIIAVLSFITASLLVLSCSVPGGLSEASLIDGGGSGDGTGETPGDGPTEEGLPAPEEEGLVAGFTFEQGGDDSSFEIVGATWTEGLNGTALMFNGYDNFIRIEDSDGLDLSTAGTVEAWIKASSHKPYAGIVHKGEKRDFSDESWMLQFWGSDGTVAVIVTSPDGTLLEVFSTFQLDLDEWYHVAATWDSDRVVLYINGQENNSRPNTVGEIRATDGGLIIGAQLSEPYNSTYGNIGFDGVIDEVNVFDRALTPEEILYRYDALML